MISRIILNCCPPFYTHLPSAAHSILKSYLNKAGFVVDVIYWNLMLEKLQKEFLFNNIVRMDSKSLLLLYFNYIAVNDDDKYIYNNLKALLKSFEPQHIQTDDCFYDRHMTFYARKLNELLDTTLEKYKVEEAIFVGFSLKLEQWLLASIIAKKIKEKYPNIPVIVGGSNTRSSAKSFLTNFPQFDISMWGEGEFALTELSNILKNKKVCDYDKIPNIAYRDNGIICYSKTTQTEFADLSSPNLYPSYDDYFSFAKEYRPNQYIYMPIEGSRGCHWNRCNFCYLNTGYKYRQKSIKKIIAELQHDMDVYRISMFEFLDNDLVGNDLKRFEELLDAFCTLKRNYPQFKIVLAEIVTRHLNRTIIKKMVDAGIVYVQIGYESPSDNLLKKINKINSFASNINFMKYACLFNISMGGINIIFNLLEEKNEDILEAIENLPFLRFCLSLKGNIRHTMTSLTINNSSRYLCKIKDDIAQWQPFTIMHYLSENLIENESKLDIFNYIKGGQDIQWLTFQRIEEHYLRFRYSYKIVLANDYYTIIEYCNENQIHEYRFKLGSLDHLIFMLTNNEPISYNDLVISVHKHNNNYKPREISRCLNKYFKNKLIYHNGDLSEIISIIDIEFYTSTHHE